jgi:hypothetical protein
MPELFGTAYSQAELFRRIGRLEQVAGVRLVTLGDGQARGVRMLEFRTGTGFAFDVLVDRSFDVGRCELGGRPLSWLSGAGVVAPWYYEPDEQLLLRRRIEASLGGFCFTVRDQVMGEGTYALALEPGTNRDGGRPDARERGGLQWLEPGEERRYELEIGALPGAAAIGHFETRVSLAIAGGRARPPADLPATGRQ